jgi:hypothetical protein
MRGVRLLLRFELSAFEFVATVGSGSGMRSARLAIMCGLASGVAGGGGHGAGRVSPLWCGMARDGLQLAVI